MESKPGAGPRAEIEIAAGVEVEVGAGLGVEAGLRSRSEPESMSKAKVAAGEPKVEWAIREPKVELKRGLGYQRSS